MTQYWHQKLHKIADNVLEIPAGCRAFWPWSMHEPLIIGLTLHFISFFPWQLKGTSPLLDLERTLQQVWKDPVSDEQLTLHKFCYLTDVLETL